MTVPRSKFDQVDRNASPGFAAAALTDVAVIQVASDPAALVTFRPKYDGADTTMADQATRTEHDSMGELEVPANALYAAQTQRAVENFPISGLTLPKQFVDAVCLIKQAAARANAELQLLDQGLADAIQGAAETIRGGDFADEFPIDVFQTGSGTSTNMNANEVLATLASRSSGSVVSPNDHVNMSQSSNDVIPTAIQLSAALAVAERLLPSLEHLAATLERKGQSLAGVTKTGRTHLMDAMPVTLGQELGGWAAQIRSGMARVQGVLPRLHALPQGGTAVGTGINAHTGICGPDRRDSRGAHRPCAGPQCQLLRESERAGHRGGAVRTC